MHGEGEWTSAYGRCEKDARGGHLPTADVKKMRGGTSAYGRCEKDASGGWTAIPKSAVYARNAVST